MSQPPHLGGFGFLSDHFDYLNKLERLTKPFGMNGIFDRFDDLSARLNPMGNLISGLAAGARLARASDSVFAMTDYRQVLDGLTSQLDPVGNILQDIRFGANLNSVAKSSLGMISGIGSEIASMVETSKPRVSPILSLTDGLTEVVAKNSDWNTQWADILRGQVGVNATLNAVEPKIEWSGTLGLAGLGDTLSHLTDTFLSTSNTDTLVADFDIVEEVNDLLRKEVVEANLVGAINSLETKIELLQEEALADRNSQATHRSINYLNAILSALLTLFLFYLSQEANSDPYQSKDQQEEVSIQDGEEAESVKHSDEIENWISKSEVNLRKEASTSSQKLGLVAEGQLVSIIDIQAKWLQVHFIENETDIPRHGFVYKEYFKPENQSTTSGSDD